MPVCCPQSSDSEDNLVLGRKASLSDLTSVGDINALSVRQLKEILARNFVNYKGCCEKWELLERVTRLYREKDLQHLGERQQTWGSSPGLAFLWTAVEGSRAWLTFRVQQSEEEGGSVLCRVKGAELCSPLLVV